MNAPASPAVATGQLTLLALDELVPSTTRVQERRRARFTDDNLRELADSLAGGMIEPIVARPRPDLGPFCAEIVAGERRWRAARMAGLHQVPVVVREYTDEDALRVQLVENLQRAELHPLDEAEGYAELMQKTGMKADDLVALTGKSRSWVYDRLKLLKLPEAAKDALTRGDIDVSRALVVSKYEGEQAAIALAKAAKKYADEVPELSVRELEETLEAEFRPPAPLDDAPPVGADDDEEDEANARAGDEARAALREEREAQWQRDQKKREEQRAFRLALFKACAAKARGPLTTAEIVDIAVDQSLQLQPEHLEAMFGKPVALDVRKMKASDLGYVIRMSLVVHDISSWGDANHLTALAKRLKVDPAKVRAAMKGGEKKAGKKGAKK